MNAYKLNEMFNEYLDEVEGPVMVLGLGYSPSQVLKATDPIAYKEAFFEWLEYEIKEGNISREDADKAEVI